MPKQHGSLLEYHELDSCEQRAARGGLKTLFSLHKSPTFLEHLCINTRNQAYELARNGLHYFVTVMGAVAPNYQIQKHGQPLSQALYRRRTGMHWDSICKT